ncbi:unnamed protein product, partial [Didymodactylos carnosus]
MDSRLASSDTLETPMDSYAVLSALSDGGFGF